MTQQVVMPQKKDDSNGLIPMAAGLVGSYYGGPAGGAAGSQAGNMAVGNTDQQVGAVQSNPRDRYMESMKSDPNNQLQQGKAALGSLDEQDRVMLQPVLDEALKRAWENKRNQGQPVGGGSEVA